MKCIIKQFENSNERIIDKTSPIAVRSVIEKNIKLEVTEEDLYFDKNNQ
jgi:hypothetical protein